MKHQVMKWLSILLLSVGCTSSRIPAGIQEQGGFYQPWTPLHTEHRAEVLKCLGLPNNRPEPTLWISRGGITVLGDSVYAIYSRTTNSVLFAGTMPVKYYWKVFRHEMVHAQERAHGPNYTHTLTFARAEECGFWPANDGRRTTLDFLRSRTPVPPTRPAL